MPNKTTVQTLRHCLFQKLK